MYNDFGCLLYYILFIVRRSLNATESETDNENTNPGTVGNNTMSASVVDGDSNFVSNDSTSQEPLIDENTTQTTATTSTDDGEVGTPLASDSESNIEAPAKLNNLTGKATEINNKISTANNNNNNNNDNNTNSNSVIGNGNGNGNGSLSEGGLGIGDSLDGENSSSALAADELTKTTFECSRAEVDDDDARMADDSNSQKMLRTANCDTLKHNKPQKRTHNSCSTADLVNNINDLSDNGLVKSADNSCSQPELKKLRSD